MYKKGDKVRLLDGRDGVVYSIERKTGRYPYDEITVKVGDKLVITYPWQMYDPEAVKELKSMTPVEVKVEAPSPKPSAEEDAPAPKRRGRPPGGGVSRKA